MKIEVYIDNQLCDIDGSNFTMRFKRQFINPTELNAKDGQRSYSVTFPATPRNNNIFGHVNIEETEDKFGKIYDNAKVYIDSVKIFDGKFRLAEITQKYYKGNLGIPAAISAKDVFGDTNMNQAGTWNIDFKGITDISTYNNKDNSECIFPLVLYGLLPKESDNNTFTPKDVFDSSVRLSLSDFPPSVNVIQMLQQIFKEAGYKLQGSAINDGRLRNLYVSYKNPEDYDMPWPVSKMSVSGVWGNYQNGKMENNFAYRQVASNSYHIIAANLFNSTTANLTIEDSSSNVYKTTSGDTRTIIFKIPQSGLYKLKFDANIKLRDETFSNPSGVGIITGDLDNRTNSKFELKVVRYSERNKLYSEDYDNTFFKNNQNQSSDADGSIYPQPGDVNFIDPLQNKDFICGFSFGHGLFHPFINPASPNKNDNPMSISGGRSWSFNDGDNGTQFRTFSAVNSPGYKKRQGGNLVDADRFKVELKNAPIYTDQTNNKNATGKISQVIWLEKGEQIDIISVSPFSFGIPAWTNHEIDLTLSLEPFRPYKSWIKMNNDGASTASMDWNDASTFVKDEINLISFLPSNIKVNDWIDNFCKAFNLILTLESKGVFSLDIKNRQLVTRLSNIIDLDKKANVYKRINQPLDLPYMYDLGFTIDSNEQGYVETMVIDKETEERILNSGKGGGGRFYTGAFPSDGTIEQTSNFSYCWYKQLYESEDDKKAENVFMEVPVITDAEIWENDAMDYEDMMNKVYFDKAQRFWYKYGVKELRLNNNVTASVALVTNELAGSNGLILDYEDKQDSILRNFFLLLTNSKNYTVIECFLSPDEYNNLSNSLIKFNGDLYHTAEINGYDPTGRDTGTLKLIKRIV